MVIDVEFLRVKKYAAYNIWYNEVKSLIETEW
jgi:hypothetical protein